MRTLCFLLRRHAVIALLLLTNACGGSDSSSSNAVSFGGAACETGATFADISGTGYDTLYNFESQSNAPVALNLDSKNNAKECEKVLSVQSVFPWVRIDTQFPDDNASKLSMQLVQEGGRNLTASSTPSSFVPLGERSLKCSGWTNVNSPLSSPCKLPVRL